MAKNNTERAYRKLNEKEDNSNVSSYSSSRELYASDEFKDWANKKWQTEFNNKVNEERYNAYTTNVAKARTEAKNRNKNAILQDNSKYGFTGSIVKNVETSNAMDKAIELIKNNSTSGNIFQASEDKEQPKQEYQSEYSKLSQQQSQLQSKINTAERDYKIAKKNKNSELADFYKNQKNSYMNDLYEVELKLNQKSAKQAQTVAHSYLDNLTDEQKGYYDSITQRSKEMLDGMDSNQYLLLATYNGAMNGDTEAKLKLEDTVDTLKKHYGMTDEEIEEYANYVGLKMGNAKFYENSKLVNEYAEKYGVSTSEAAFLLNNWNNLNSVVDNEQAYNDYKNVVGNLSDEELSLFGNLYEAGQIKNSMNNAGIWATADIKYEKNAKKLREMGWSDSDIESTLDAYSRTYNKEAYDSFNAAADVLIRNNTAAALAMNVGEVALSPISGSAAFGGAVNGAITKHFTGKDIDPYGMDFRLNNNSSAIMNSYNNRIQDISDRHNWDSTAGKFAYGVGNSTLKSLYAAQLGGAAASGVAEGLASIGIGEKAIETIARVVASGTTLPAFGGSAYSSALSEAYDKGLGADQAEAYATMSGINEMLFEVASLDKMYSAFKNGSKAGLKVMIKEALIGSAIEGTEEGFTDLANWYADELINRGLSEYELLVREYGEEYANNYYKKQLIQDVAAGMVSGFISNAGEAAKGSLGYVSAANTIAKNDEYNNNVISAIQDAQSQTTSRDIADSLKDGQKLNTAQVMDIMMDAQANGDVNTINTISDSLVDNSMKTAVEKHNKKIEKIGANQKNIDEKGVSASDITDIKKNIDGSYTLTVGKGTKVKASNVSMKSVDDVNVVNDAIRFSDNNARAKAYLEGFKGADITSDMYDTVFNQIVRSVSRGAENVADVYNDPSVNNEYMKSLTDSGVATIFDYALNNAKAINEKQVKIVENLSKVTGRNVVLGGEQFANGGIHENDNGYYDANTDTIYISDNAEDPITVVFAHEFLHSVAKNNQKAYQEILDSSVNFFKKFDSEAYDMKFARKAKLYADEIAQWKNNGKDWKSMIDEEICAEMTESLVEKLASMSETELKEFLASRTKEERNFIKKIVDAIKKFIEGIRDSLPGYKDSSSDIWKKTQRNMDQLDVFFDRYMSAMADAANTKESEGKFTDARNNTNVAEKTVETAMKSKKDGIENTDDLLAVHNLNEKELLWCIENGGFPSPSIAIIRKGMSHSNYGNISVLFNKETIDPKGNKNYVYGADAYTPVVEGVEYEIKQKEFNYFSDYLKGLGEKCEPYFRSDLYNIIYNLSNGVATPLSAEDLFEKYKSSENIKVAYLESIGEHINPVITEAPKGYDENKIDIYKKIISHYGKNELNNYNSIKFRDDYRDNWFEKNGKDFIQKIAENELDKNSKKPLRIAINITINRLLNDSIDYINQYGKPAEKVIDSAATSDAVNEKLIGNETKFESWLKNNIDSFIGERGIRNNKDYITEKGRRTFKQLYVKYTLENIVKAMYSQQENRSQNANARTAEGLQSATAKSYYSIKDIKEDSGRIQQLSDEEYKALTDDISERIASILDTVDKQIDNSGWIYNSVAADTMIKAAQGTRTIEAIKKTFNKEGISLSNEMAGRILDLFEESANMKTKYFEAKPQRIVYNEEIAKVVLPNNVSNDLLVALAKNNIDYDTYNPGAEEERKNLINDENIMFSKKDSEGNILFDEQIDFFKNTKVRDENGNLLVMYHGTPNKGFTVFRVGSYFTNSKEYADRYKNPAASSNRVKTESNNPGVYKGYLNIEKPFDTRDPKVKKIWDNEYYHKYDTGELAESGLPDWTSADGLIDFIKENGYDFDGIILDEGADGGYGYDVESRGLSYVPINASNQFKSIDNLYPTNDSDIMKSKKDSEKPRKAKDQRNQGYMLSESKFYQLYLQHHIDYTNASKNRAALAESIKKNGFISYNLNVTPLYKITRFNGVSNYKWFLAQEEFGNFEKGTAENYKKKLGKEFGKPIFDNIVQQEFAPRKGDVIMLVPSYEVDKDKVKNGFKPFDWEVLTVERDYQDLYELYAETYDKYHDGVMKSKKDNDEVFPDKIVPRQEVIDEFGEEILSKFSKDTFTENGDLIEIRAGEEYTDFGEFLVRHDPARLNEHDNTDAILDKLFVSNNTNPVETNSNKNVATNNSNKSVASVGNVNKKRASYDSEFDDLYAEVGKKNAKSIAGSILRDTGSKADRSNIEQAIAKAYSMMKNSSEAEVKEFIKNNIVDVVGNAIFITTDEYADRRKAVKDYFKGSPVYFDEKQVEAIKYRFGSVKEYNKQLAKEAGVGVVKLTDNPRYAIDKKWDDEIKDVFGDLWYDVSSNDEPEALLAALHDLRPTERKGKLDDPQALVDSVYSDIKAISGSNKNNDTVLDNVLKAGFNETSYKNITDSEIMKIADELINETKSTYDRESLGRNLIAMFKYISKRGNTANQKDFFKIANDIAMPLLMESPGKSSQYRAENAFNIALSIYQKYFERAGSKNTATKLERMEKALKEKYEKRINRLKENQKKTELKKGIYTKKARLDKMLTHPTKGSHIPLDLVHSAVDIAEAINTEGKRMGWRTEDKLAELAKAYEDLRGKDYYKDHFDEGLKSMIEQLKRTFAGKTLNNLTVDELEYVDKVLNAIFTQVSNENKLVSMNRAETIAELNERGVREVLATRGIKRDNFLERGWNFYQSVALNFERLLNRSFGYVDDSVAKVLIEAAKSGEIKSMTIAQEGEDIFAPVLGDANRKNLFDLQGRKSNGKGIDKSKWVELPEFGYQVPKALRLSFIMQLRDNDALRHLAYGGLVLPNEIEYARGNYADAYADGVGVRVAIPFFNDEDVIARKELIDSLETTEERQDKNGNPITYHVPNKSNPLYIEYEKALKARNAVSPTSDLYADRQNAVDAAWKKYQDAVRDAYNLLDNIIKKKAEEYLPKLMNDLSDYERDFLKCAENFFWDYSGKQINKVTRNLYGYDKATIKHYFPISVDKGSLELDSEGIKRDGTLEGMGTLKERVQSKKPILLEDISKVAARHITSTAKFAGWAESVRDIKSVLRNSSSGSTIIGSINNKWLDAGKYIEDTINDIESPRNGNKFDRMANKIRSNFAGSTLTGNFTVMIKQAASFPTAIAETGYKATMKALKNVGSKGIEEVESRTPLLRYRQKASEFTYETGTDLTQNKVVKGLANMISWMDVRTVRTLEYAAKYYVDEHIEEYGVEIGSDEYWDAVTDKFNEVIRQTQPNYTTLERPELLKNQNAMLRTLFMFKTQPMQNYGIIYDAVAECNAKAKAYKDNKTEANKKALADARLKLTRAIGSNVISQVVFALMTMIGKLLYHNPGDLWDEEEEKFDEEAIFNMLLDSVLSSEFGMIAGGQELYEFIRYKIEKSVLQAKKDRGEDTNGKTVRYYGLEDSIVEMFNDVANTLDGFTTAISNLADANTDADKEKAAITLGYKARMLATSLANVFGIPANNVYKPINAIVGYAQDIANGKLYSGNGVLTNNTSDVLSQEERAANAYEEGNMEEYDRLMAQKPNADVRSEIKTGYIEGLTDYETAMSYLVEEYGKTEDEAYWTIDEWNYIKDNGTSDGYKKYGDILDKVADGSATKDDLDRYLNHGVDKTTLKTQIMQWYHEWMKENGTSATMNANVLNALQKIGYNRNEVNKDIQAWIKKNL